MFAMSRQVLVKLGRTVIAPASQDVSRQAAVDLLQFTLNFKLTLASCASRCLLSHGCSNPTNWVTTSIFVSR